MRPRIHTRSGARRAPPPGARHRWQLTSGVNREYDGRRQTPHDDPQTRKRKSNTLAEGRSRRGGCAQDASPGNDR
jgi:hypothetical protein